MLDGQATALQGWISGVSKTEQTRFDRKGVELTFTKSVKLHSLEIVVRPDCCNDLYKNVCFVVDGAQIGCTSNDFLPPKGSVINFVDEFAAIDLVGRTFSVLFEDKTLNAHAQIFEFKAIYFEQG